MVNKNNIFSDIRADFASGLVVFLIAFPLCLGIAMASGAPLFSGIISGVIGGIFVGYLSQSHVSVSGPTAGLVAIIMTAITDLGAFNIFLTAVFLAGLLQLLLGFIRAGSISNYFPKNVIEGMMAGIGIIIVLKQIPHAVGLDNDYEGNLSFINTDGSTIFNSLFTIFDHFHLGVIIVVVISLLILICWEKIYFFKKLKLISGALVAVIISIILNEFFRGSLLEISKEHLVSLPILGSLQEFKDIIMLPDFSAILNPQVWMVAFTITVITSIETLLCIEASDRMDIQRRYTSTNHELKAQGLGNIVSSLLGGLPIASVVVRSSANVNAGAKTKMSTIIHGLLLVVSVLFIPKILNKIPFATLAAILLLVGYKLAKPSIIIYFWKKGKYQFIPFIVTLLGVVFTDLSKGVALGIVVSIFFVLRGNLKRAYYFKKEEYEDGDIINIDLAQEVSFLNKAAIKNTLSHLPENSKVIINASDTVYIAHDVLDLIKEFEMINVKEKNIELTLIGFKDVYELENTNNTPNYVSVQNNEVVNFRKNTISSYKQVMKELKKREPKTNANNT